MVKQADLIKKLVETKDIVDFISKNENLFKDECVSDYLNRKIFEKNLTVSEVGKRSLQSEYIYKIFNGTRNASRDVILAIGLGLELGLDGITELLTIAGFASLNPENKKDAVLIHCFCNSKTAFEAKAILEQIKEKAI